jgi:hypothetical protein
MIPVEEKESNAFTIAVCSLCVGWGLFFFAFGYIIGRFG